MNTIEVLLSVSYQLLQEYIVQYVFKYLNDSTLTILSITLNLPFSIPCVRLKIKQI